MTHFEAYEDLDGRWRWRMIAANQRIIASSGESFDSHANAVRAARTVRDNAAASSVSSKPGIGIKALLRFSALIHGEATPAVNATARPGAVRAREGATKRNRGRRAAVPARGRLVRRTR